MKLAVAVLGLALVGTSFAQANINTQFAEGKEYLLMTKGKQLSIDDTDGITHYFTVLIPASEWYTAGTKQTMKAKVFDKTNNETYWLVADRNITASLGAFNVKSTE